MQLDEAFDSGQCLRLVSRLIIRVSDLHLRLQSIVAERIVGLQLLEQADCSFIVLPGHFFTRLRV
ncbi:hypothetical protein D3C72_2363930 [compost metagenome]